MAVKATETPLSPFLLSPPPPSLPVCHKFSSTFYILLMLLLLNQKLPSGSVKEERGKKRFKLSLFMTGLLQFSANNILKAIFAVTMTSSLTKKRDLMIKHSGLCQKDL